MPELYSFDYAIIRVVPRVEREEFINVGVILSCPARQFLKAKIELDRGRLSALAPSLDPKAIEDYLDSIPTICEGGAKAGVIGQMGQRARFHWLVAQRSTIIQTSPAHSGLCADPETAIEQLLANMVRLSDTRSESSTPDYDIGG